MGHMATLTIKNLPDPLYARLKARAAEHRRSINSEAILAVERALTATAQSEPASMLAALKRSRARIKGVYVTDRDIADARKAGRA